MTRARWTAAAVAVAVTGALGLGLDASLGADDADRVTLRAQPLVVGSGTRVTLFGSVDNGRAGEDIKIQAKDCGRDFFRVVSGAVTREGGEWMQFYWLQGPTTTLRAVWNDATSAGVTIRRRAYVGLERRSPGRFEVTVVARAAWRKRAFIQRFDRRLGTWQAVRSVVLTDDTYGRRASAVFTISLPKGTRIRAVFPRSQAGPCYLTGTSHPLTT